MKNVDLKYSLVQRPMWLGILIVVLILMLAAFFSMIMIATSAIENRLHPASALLYKLQSSVEASTTNITLARKGWVSVDHDKNLMAREIEVPGIIDKLGHYMLDKKEKREFSAIVQAVNDFRWQKWKINDVVQNRADAHRRAVILKKIESLFKHLKSNLNRHSKASGFESRSVYMNLYRVVAVLEADVTKYIETGDARYADSVKANLEELKKFEVEVGRYPLDSLVAYVSEYLSPAGRLEMYKSDERFKERYLVAKRHAEYTISVMLRYFNSKIAHAYENIMLLVAVSMVLVFMVLILLLLGGSKFVISVGRDVIRSIYILRRYLVSANNLGKIKDTQELVPSELNELKGLIDSLVLKCNQLSNERRENKGVLDRMANYDSLTGLRNLKSFEQAFYKVTRSVSLNRSELSLVYFDISNFSDVVSILGEKRVLIMLVKFSDIMSKYNALCSKVSDSRFLFFIVSQSGGGAISKLHTFKSHLEFALNESGLNSFVRYHIGTVFYSEHKEPVNKLVLYAQFAAMNAALSVEMPLYTPELHVLNKRMHALEKDMAAAIGRGEFYVVYQPQVCLKTGEVIGCEALIRWQHPFYGNISPGEFVPISEKTGDIFILSSFMRKTALKDLASWSDLLNNRGRFKMSLNASVLELMTDEYCEKLMDEITECGVSAAQVEIEVTEGALSQNFQSVLSTLHQLKNNAIKVAIDDFGTGYSSLERLLSVKFDLLKIDKVFVDKILIDDRSKNLLKSIIRLAEAVGLETIAEGVESKNQVELLRYHHCNYVQGYYFYKPISADEMVRLLSANS